MVMAAIKTLELGELEGELLFFGGPYSNLHATKALKSKADFLSISSKQIFCTGDLVAYCSEPNQTIEYIKEWGIHSIIGNVEQQLTSNADNCGCGFSEDSLCNTLSIDWYTRTKQELIKSQIKWMQTLPEFITFSFSGLKFLIIHGSVSNISEFIFESTPWELKKKIFEQHEVDVIIAGHSGIPFIQKDKEHTWINAGVIGMPANDGTPRVWYVTVKKQEEQIKATINALNYDHCSASEAMHAEGWSAEYAQTLNDGLWCSEDILPSAEREKKGIELKPQSSFFNKV